MSDMIRTIQSALRTAGVETWKILESETESAELFFVRRALDMRRMKKITKYAVGVYRDFEKDGQKMRGYSSVVFVPAQTEEEILKSIQAAYYAASFVTNPTYALPQAEICAPFVMESDLSALPVEQAALKMAGALYEADDDLKSFVNSSEIFAVRGGEHLYTSWGTDTAYVKYSVKGEFVVQCKSPEDVESYHAFAYDTLDLSALREKVKTALSQVGDRAVAKQELPSGTYRVLLSGEQTVTVLSYYIERTHAAMIYPGYSVWKMGDDTQGEMSGGERLNLSLIATVPYSDEGVAMQNREVLSSGRVALIHGGARMCSYLGVPPTGDYSAFRCDNGTADLSDMKKEPYLYAVSFSDFQMDSFSGHFGGEIRLAYYFDGERTRIVTGGSINGSINDCAGGMIFSSERYDSADYHGPFAVCLQNVKVAGTV